MRWRLALDIKIVVLIILFFFTSLYNNKTIIFNYNQLIFVIKKNK